MTTPRFALSPFALFAALTLALTAPFVPALLVPALAQRPLHGVPNSNPNGLTPAQKQQATAIGRKFGQQMQALQANTSLTPAARQAKMHALQQSVRSQLMAIMTPAQRARMQGR